MSDMCKTGICSSPTHCKHVGYCADGAAQPARQAEGVGLFAPFSSREDEQLFDDICNAARDPEVAARLMGIAPSAPKGEAEQRLEMENGSSITFVPDGMDVIKGEDANHTEDVLEMVAPVQDCKAPSPGPARNEGNDPQRMVSGSTAPVQGETPDAVDVFLNGRLPCSSLEVELIAFARRLNAAAPGEAVAWIACCAGPIFAREVFLTLEEAKACADAWDHCSITPLYVHPKQPAPVADVGEADNG